MCWVFTRKRWDSLNQITQWSKRGIIGTSMVPTVRNPSNYAYPILISAAELPVTKLQSQWLRCIIGQLIVKEKDATILRQILTSHEHLGLGTACCYTTHGLQSWLARRWRHLQFIGCLFIKEVNHNLVLKRLGHIPNNIPNKALLDMPTALKPLMN